MIFLSWYTYSLAYEKLLRRESDVQLSQHHLMDTFFDSARNLLKELEIHFLYQRLSDATLLLENLSSSSSLLGFLSLAYKSNRYLTLLAHKQTVDTARCASIISDLLVELRRCEQEWFRARNSLPNTS